LLFKAPVDRGGWEAILETTTAMLARPVWRCAEGKGGRLYGKSTAEAKRHFGSARAETQDHATMSVPCPLDCQAPPIGEHFSSAFSLHSFGAHQDDQDGLKKNPRYSTIYTITGATYTDDDDYDDDEDQQQKQQHIEVFAYLSLSIPWLIDWLIDGLIDEDWL